MRSAQSAHVAVQGVVVVGRYQALSPHLAGHVNRWQRWRGRRVPAWTVGEAEHLTIGTDADVMVVSLASLVGGDVYPSAEHCASTAHIFGYRLLGSSLHRSLMIQMYE